jgi:hypothetical protein
MSGLIDQAEGGRRRPDQVADQARQAWQESMLRPIDELAQSLRQRDPAAIAHRSGCGFDGHVLQLVYWQQPIYLPWPDLTATRSADGQPCSTFDHALLLYYLDCSDGAPLADRWIGFRELPNGAFYHQAYQGYSGNRIAQAFGSHPEGFHGAARGLGGEPIADLGAPAFAFQPLPRIRLAAVLWPGDEEFSARGAVLFDAASSHYMTTDGLALLGGGLAGRLVRAAPAAQS